MIILKRPCQQAGGDMSEEFLSSLPDGTMTRWRQDFELRVATEAEFQDDKEAIRFLELLNKTEKDSPQYVSSGLRIWNIEGKDIYYYCDIVEV